MLPQKTPLQEVIIEAWHMRVWRRYQESWFDKYFRFSAPFALLFFTLSIVANYYAGIYATSRASNYVEDIVLSNIPAFDVDIFFVYGAVLLVAVIFWLCFGNPKRIPFLLHSLTLFIFIRAAFVSMTHLGPFPTAILVDDVQIFFSKYFLFGGDLFFSGHTGIPFLMALMFWHRPMLRYLFLAWSVFFGVIVLLGHLHYTIDVASAFFITYGIYHAALWFFPRERILFLSDR